MLEQISPLRSNFNQKTPCVARGIRAGPANQLGDRLIVMIEPVSNVGAQRVELTSTPFHDGKALSVGYEQMPNRRRSCLRAYISSQTLAG